MVDWCTRGPSFATSFLDLQVCQHDVAGVVHSHATAVAADCQGASRRRFTWTAGRTLSTPIAISVGSTHLASAFGPAVWLRLEGGDVPLAEPTAAFGERCAVGSARAEPREAKMRNMTFHIHRSLQYDPKMLKSRDTSGIKLIPIPYHICHYHTTSKKNQKRGKYHTNTGKL